MSDGIPLVRLSCAFVVLFSSRFSAEFYWTRLKVVRFLEKVIHVSCKSE